MVDYKYSDLFLKDSVDKQLIIEFDGGKITNEDLHAEQFELQESICSETQLAFGSCEASQIKFRVSNIFDSLKKKWLTVSMVLDGNTDEPFVFGRYKVETDTPTADRSYRDITAYDAMNDIINADVAEWYNSLTFPLTLKQFRDSFFEYLGIEQQEVTLINDNMIVNETIQPSALSGRDVCVSICQLNGCFGHIGRMGEFCYIFLPKDIQGLYPANDLYPSNDLYPVEPGATNLTKSMYINCKYEDYVCKEITKLQIRKEENDVGATSGTDGNTYIVENNFLVYGMSSNELQVVCDNLLSVISKISYRPFESTSKGNPCYPVGEPVRMITKYKIIESYILKRTLSGIQSLRDSFYADGEEIYTEKLNTIQNSIIELKGKTNSIQSTVEETKLEIKDMEKGLSSRIEQTVKSITLEISNGEKTAGIVITLENEKGQKQEVSGKIEMTGIVTFKNLSESGQTVINGSNITTGTINCNLLNGGVINGQSIEGGTIVGTNITGSAFSGGVFQSESGNYKTEISAGIARTTLIRLIPPVSGTGFLPGIARMNQALTKVISGIYFKEDGTIETDGDLEIGLNAKNRLYALAVYTEGCVVGTTMLRPTEGGTISCGHSSYKWSTVYAKDGSINTSDKNLKKDFENFSEQYEELFLKLTPTLYKFNDGIRKHSGFVSQDVENAMIDCGLTDLDFAGFCRDVKTEITIDEDGKEIEKPVLDEDGKEQYIYSLRYSEFIALNTHMIQKLHKENEEMKTEIAFLKETVSFLMQEIESLKGQVY